VHPEGIRQLEVNIHGRGTARKNRQLKDSGQLENNRKLKEK
jgi:hypothetical protein